MSFANITKNASAFSNLQKFGELDYILTDALDFVLLGTNEDEVLIWQQATAYTNITKN